MISPSTIYEILSCNGIVLPMYYKTHILATFSHASISAVGPSHDGGQTDRHDIAESILISEALSIIMQCVPTLGLGHNNSVSYHSNTTWHHLRTFCPPLNIPFQQ